MKKFSRVLAMVLAAVMLVSVVPMNAQAASKVTAATKFKKAKAIKKGKTYTVSAKASKQCYVKFTAPAAGKYKFTISAMKVKGNSGEYGGFGICTYYDKYLWPEYVKTEGGTTDYLNMADKRWWTEFDCKNAVSTDQNRYTRNATIKLKKGQTAYVRSWSTANSGTMTYSLKVVKK